MKQLLLIPVLFLFLLTGCEKEDPVIPEPAIAPQAFAGTDFVVVLPADSATLNGRADDTPSDILQYNWKKISGPASYVIESPGSLKTDVRNLVKGTYEFELTVTDRGGLTGMDTVKVDVHDPYTGVPQIPIPNELIFNDLLWIFPWYASIEVKDIGNRVPVKVFIQRDFDAAWIEVSYISISGTVSNPYEYFIETRPYGAGMYTYGSLYIFYYGNITNDTPQVKIEF